jgi:cyclopropane-fatty-acyl-phospholipid synthase
VTSINIADEQLRFAREHCRGTSVEVVKCDYRDVRGTFDKMTVVAMMSHVGHKNHHRLFRTLHDHLAPGGRVFVDTVGSDVSLVAGNPWIDRYVFPGIVFPSISQISRAVEGLFVVDEIFNFGPSYVKTLRAWNANLQSAWPRLAAQHDERTRRMFEFFFLTVAGFFRARDFQNWYIVLSKRGVAPAKVRPTTVTSRAPLAPRAEEAAS